MRRWLFTVACLYSCALFTACSNDAFVPPTKSKSSASSGSGTMPSKARSITFVLPEVLNDDLRAIEQVARLDLGENRSIFNLLQPAANDPPTKQAELIREAVQKGASAIVVVPNQSKETAEAIAAIDQKKCPVVLLARTTVTPPPSGTTFITWPDFAPTAKEIVAAISEDAKRASLPDNAPVILLVNEPADETSVARGAALRAAIKASTHPIAAEVPIIEDSVSRGSIMTALKANPKVCAVIGDDSLGITIASALRGELKNQGVFLIGGYCTSPKSVSIGTMNQNSILVDRARDNSVRKAISVAIERIDGKTFPDRVEVELTVKRNQGNPVAPPAVTAPVQLPTGLPEIFTPAK